MRVFYAAGPGRVINTYRHWVRGEDDPGVPDVAYSWQFFDVCRSRGAQTWVVSAYPSAETLDDGAFRIEHRPIPFDNSGGLAFHVGRVAYTLALMRSALQFKADIAVFAHGVH